MAKTQADIFLGKFYKFPQARMMAYQQAYLRTVVSGQAIQKILLDGYEELVANQYIKSYDEMSVGDKSDIWKDVMKIAEAEPVRTQTRVAKCLIALNFLIDYEL
ncbi:MAG: hypothetical protein C5B59_08020 [Bacteroidetes bacterium]|nr:MAG: hypothetical protein C5B59_08020 [Bacteroidota bacterium]